MARTSGTTRSRATYSGRRLPAASRYPPPRYCGQTSLSAGSRGGPPRFGWPRDSPRCLGGGMGLILLARRSRGDQRAANDRGQVTDINVRKVIEPCYERLPPAEDRGGRPVVALHVVGEPGGGRRV